MSRQFPGYAHIIFYGGDANRSNHVFDRRGVKPLITLSFNDLHYAGGSGSSSDPYSFASLINLTVTSESETKGTVTGSGSYAPESSVTVVATPKAGYIFEG